MFSNTLSFLSSRNVSDQVSHPYKTTGKQEKLFAFNNLRSPILRKVLLLLIIIDV